MVDLTKIGRLEIEIFCKFNNSKNNIVTDLVFVSIPTII